MDTGLLLEILDWSRVYLDSNCWIATPIDAHLVTPISVLHKTLVFMWTNTVEPLFKDTLLNQDT